MLQIGADSKPLSSEECELMIAVAASRGRLRICTRSDTHGRAVCAKERTFADPADRSLAERYIQAVFSLERLLFIRQCDQRNTYELTNMGWQTSRALTRTAEPARVEQHASTPQEADGSGTLPVHL